MFKPPLLSPWRLQPQVSCWLGSEKNASLWKMAKVRLMNGHGQLASKNVEVFQKAGKQNPDVDLLIGPSYALQIYLFISSLYYFLQITEGGTHSQHTSLLLFSQQPPWELG
uniref:Uncharacterized protein n=1 Tax=Micrurus lemniscatus lemniscatus TaxID=129467 RepID=A0A2D4J2U0_MICLE